MLFLKIKQTKKTDRKAKRNDTKKHILTLTRRQRPPQREKGVFVVSLGKNLHFRFVLIGIIIEIIIFIIILAFGFAIAVFPERVTMEILQNCPWTGDCHLVKGDIFEGKKKNYFGLTEGYQLKRLYNF